MSRAEEITSEVRKLVMTCRAMEAQLQQSITKKAHQEVVSKMQASIDGLNSELENTRAELKNTVSVGDRVNALATQLSSTESSVANLSSQLTSLRDTNETQSKTIEALGATMASNVESLGAKLARETVPVLLYNETLSRIGELEEKMRFMVDRNELVGMQKRCDELAEKITTTVPTADYLALQSQFVNYVPKAQFEELQRNLAASVPREELSMEEARGNDLEARLAATVQRVDYEKLEARNAELEAKLSNSVPKSDYEELAGKIASLAKEAAVSNITLEVVTPSNAAPSPESVPEAVSAAPEQAPPTAVPEVTSPIPAPIASEVVPAASTAPEVVPSLSTAEVPVAPIAAEITAAPVAVPEVVAPAAEVVTAPAVEITEVQSNLSELQGVTATGAPAFDPSPAPKVVDASLGFSFHNTEFCAKSGLEFLEDVEKVPLETLESHALNGDFERWFKDVLQDAPSSESLKSVRESNLAGEELRTKIVAVIATNYRHSSA